MVVLSYKNGIEIVKNGFELKKNFPTKEYITFDTGNNPYHFIVDDKKKTITIKDANNLEVDVIDPEIKFKLWESKYTDLIYPGKQEIIHKDTLVRSTRFTSITDCVDDVALNFDIKKYGMKLEHYKDSYVLSYIIKSNTMAYLPFIYYGLKDSLKQISVRPLPNETPDLKLKSIFCKLEEICYILDYFNETELNDIWLVFTKLEPKNFYLVSGYSNAKKLLSRLKYGIHMNEFVCGVSVFEDYYFMPIHHKMISSDVKGNMTMTLPIDNIKLNQYELGEILLDW
jgi:hypothetical protein